jgi:hypothetical protein
MFRAAFDKWLRSNVTKNKRDELNNCKKKSYIYKSNLFYMPKIGISSA